MFWTWFWIWLGVAIGIQTTLLLMFCIAHLVMRGFHKEREFTEDVKLVGILLLYAFVVSLTRHPEKYEQSGFVIYLIAAGVMFNLILFEVAWSWRGLRDDLIQIKKYIARGIDRNKKEATL